MAEFLVSTDEEGEDIIKTSTPYAAAHRYAEKFLTTGVADDEEFMVKVISKETGLALNYVVRANVAIHWVVTKEDLSESRGGR